MSINEIIQEISDSRIDARSLSEFIFKPTGFKVERRLAPPIDTLNFYLNRFDTINSTYTQSVATVNNAVNQAQQSVIAADALITTNASNSAAAVASAIEGVAIDANLVTDALIKTVPRTGMVSRNQQSKNSDSITVKDFGAISDGAYHPLSERYATLAEAQEVYPHALALTDSIDWCAAQAFLDACHVHQYANADMTMDAVITRPLKYQTHKFHATQVISGDTVLRGLKGFPLDYFLNWQGAYTQHTGSITCHGVFEVGGDNFTKIHKNGVLLGSEILGNNGSGGALGAQINSVVSYNLSGYSFIFGQTTHFAKVGYVHSGSCGSAVKVDLPLLGDDVSSKTTWSERVDIASMYDLGAVSKLKVARLPPSQTAELEVRLLEGVLVVIGDDIHAVTAVDRLNSTISVRPQLTPTDLTGNLSYIYGGGVLTIGNDTANTTIERVNAILSGICVRSFALWATSITSFTAEFCGAAFVHSARGSISMGTTIDNAYFEANKFDYVQLWNQGYSNPVIHNSMGLRADGMASLFTALGDGRVRADVGTFQGSVKIGNENYAPLSSGMELSDKGGIRTVQGDAPNITINVDDDLYRLYAKRTMLYCFHAETSTGAPPRDITINVPRGIHGSYENTMTITSSEYGAPILVSAVIIGDGRLSIKVITPKRPVTVTPPASSGVTANRPQGMPAGYQYFDTTLGKPVYYKADGEWVDATGATV